MDPIPVDLPAAPKPAPVAKPDPAAAFGLLGWFSGLPFSKRQAVGAGVAALSLCAGVAVVKFGAPAAPGSGAADKALPETAKATPPKAETPKAEPVLGPPGATFPARLPDLPAAPAAKVPDAVATHMPIPAAYQPVPPAPYQPYPPAAAPVRPPSVAPDAPSVLPPLPNVLPVPNEPTFRAPGGAAVPLVVPPAPPTPLPELPGGVVRIGANDVKAPAAPPTPPTPPILPALPTAPGATPGPMVPAAPPALPTPPVLAPTAPARVELPAVPNVAPTAPALPAAPSVVPAPPAVVPMAPPSIVPSPPSLVPAAPPAPPSLAPPIPGGPVSGAPVVPAPPTVVPDPPALVPAPPAVVPSPPAFVPTSPAPAALPPTVTPAAGVRPSAGPDRTPQTSFDVDLHEPKAGESYEGISKSFYNDARYARALAAFNGNKALTGGGVLEVPPVHVLKRRYPQMAGADFAPPAADPAPAFRAVGAKRFVVPAGGMSLTAVARQTLGSEARWRDVYDLNPRVTPDFVTGGTELRLPADATVP